MMGEKIDIKAVQVEMPRIRDIRRAGIKILMGEEELVTLTYVPDSSLVLIMDGQTNASGLGLITQVDSLGDTMAEKINTYLGLKHMKLNPDNLKTLLAMLADFNDGKIAITNDRTPKSKGSRAKRVYSIDLGRAILSIDPEYILTVDDGFGNKATFDMKGCGEVKVNPELTGDNKKDKGKDNFVVELSNSSLEHRFNPFRDAKNLQIHSYSSNDMLTSANTLIRAQAINLAELNLAEEKKRIREEERANKEPKSASKKDVLMLMIHNLIESLKEDNPEVYTRIGLPTYNENYAEYIVKVLDPVCRLAQRKSVVEYLGDKIKDPSSEEFINAYEHVIIAILLAFDPEAENVMNEEMKALDVFSKDSNNAS